MRILEINKFLYPKGGAETYLLSLIELLRQNSQEVICFSQASPKNILSAEEKYFIDDLDLSNFSFQSLLKLPRIFWSFKARRLVKKLITLKRPDIVHIHNIYHQISPSILPLLKKAGLPIVMTVHDFKLITPRYTLRADGQKLWHKKSLVIDFILRLEFNFHRLLKVYTDNIDLFIAPSEFVKGKLVEAGFPANRIMVIPHFLPTKFLADETPAVAKSKTDKYLFSYGRLDENKGFDDLIRAVADLDDSDIKLIIAGTGPEANRLNKLIAELNLADRVELVGQKTQPEIIQLIKKSLAVINCSHVHETFGLTILEALALGKPVVASRVGATAELIVHNQNGLLYSVGDQNDLKKQLAKILTDAKLRQRLQTATQKTAANYNGQEHYRDLMSVFETAITDFKCPIRRVSTTIIRAAALTIFALLLLVPFYRINIEQGSALVILKTDYPRLANLYWKNPIDMNEAEQLAKWDLLVLDMQTQTNSAEAIKKIRQLNPNIIILAYTTANEMPLDRLSAVEPSGAGLWHDLASGDKSVWHLKTVTGEDVVFWPGNVMMNLGTTDNSGRTYGDYLVDFYDQKILSSGLWDGLLFDNIWQNVSQVNKNIDINADGQSDDTTKINSLWQNYYRDFFQKLRNRLGSRYLIIGNGDGAYQQFLNGRMFEGFPEYWEGGWTGSMKRLAETTDSGFNPRLNIINSDTGNTGNKYDFESMRFGLMSALMFDAYYSFDYGTQLREQLWWYDEYDANLGQPTGAPKNLLSKTNELKEGVWQRDFEHGIVLVNSTNQPQNISLDADYEKLRGTESTNDGSIVNSVIIPAHDGLILKRLINTIDGATYLNGAFARVFNADGQIKRTGFFVYDANYPGGATIIKTDLNADNENETIVAGKTTVNLYDKNSQLLKSVQPYGANYAGGFSLAVSPKKNNQRNLFIAPEIGGSNLIKIYDGDFRDTGRGFNAYSPIWKNLGASIAVCDVNRDGQIEIITGAGFGGGPHIKVFSEQGQLLKEWFAYGTNFRGGVNVACGDIDHDGQAEIITGAGSTGGPHVRIFNGEGKLSSQWFAYDSNKRQGVRVTAVDIDADGNSEVIALSTNVFVTR